MRRGTAKYFIYSQPPALFPCLEFRFFLISLNATIYLSFKALTEWTLWHWLKFRWSAYSLACTSHTYLHAHAYRDTRTFCVDARAWHFHTRAFTNVLPPQCLIGCSACYLLFIRQRVPVRFATIANLMANAIAIVDPPNQRAIPHRSLGHGSDVLSNFQFIQNSNRLELECFVNRTNERELNVCTNTK